MELMAVIVVLAVVILIATSSVNALIKRARRGTSEEMRNMLKESALTYSIGNKKTRLEKCNASDISKIESGSYTGNCAIKIFVLELTQDGIFEDKKGYCKDDFVVVYRSDRENSEYRAFVKEDACTNY